MKHNRFTLVFIFFTVFISLLFLNPTTIGAQENEPQVPANPNSAIGTAFTYQGRLTDGGFPANGSYNFRFYLWDDEAKTTLLGTYPEVGTIEIEVADGYFPATIDFGVSVFDGDERWLEIEVNGTLLSPLQLLTSAPYAVYAQTAPWDGLSGVPGDFADGVDADTTYTPGYGLDLVAGEFSVDTTEIQNRVDGMCPTGQFIWMINSNGSVACEQDNDTTYSGGNQIQLSGTTFNVLEGSGSGLDADLLDGQHASGFASTVHDHLGQTWTGSNNSLRIGGSFDNPDYAPLVLGNSNPIGNGLKIETAGYDGVRVYSVGDDGVQVNSAGGDGFYVNSASGFGVQVNSAGGDGVHVNSAGSDGVSVYEAGTPSTHNASTASNGFEVEGAEGNGLFVGMADNHGVHVESTGNDGVRVDDANQDGMQVGNGTDFPLYGFYIPSPGVPYTALWPRTSNADGEWALYTTDKINAANVTMSSLTLVAQVTGPDDLTPGDLVAVVGMADPLPGSQYAMPLVGLTNASQNGVIGVAESRMAFHQAEGREEGVLVLRSVSGPARDGDYVALTVFGITEVKVDSRTVEIESGGRLTASDVAGHARGLRTESLNGMVVTEGAPVIGIALEAPQPGSDFIPVLVTLR